jgi:hypothetical protein
MSEIKYWIIVGLCLFLFCYTHWVLSLHPERQGFPVIAMMLLSIAQWVYLAAGVALTIAILVG